MTTRKLFRKIHLWMSVPLGLVMAVVCFTGAMLVFEDEVDMLTRRSLFYVDDTSGGALPMGVLMERVGRSLPDNVSITGVTVYADPSRTYEVSLSKPHRAALYVDQYTGEVKGRHERSAFFTAMFFLHRWLFDAPEQRGDMTVGKMVVGISVIMFVLALVSGVVLWWPRRRGELRRRLTVTVGRGAFRFWHSLHVAGGMYVVVLLLAMALTGLTWSFGWYRTGFYAVFGVEQGQGSGRPAAKAAVASAHGGADAGGAGAGKERSAGGGASHGNRGGRGEGRGGHGERQLAAGSEYAGWQAVCDRLKAGNPGFSRITVGSGTATVSHGGFGNSRAADRYTFDKASGSISGSTLYAGSAPSGKLRGWIYSVHVGSFGGLFTRILWFLAALLGAVLPLTGYYLWMRRLLVRR